MNHTIIQRFFNKVDISTEGMCWIWRGSLTTRGYGQFYFDNKLVTAHRWIYEQLIAPVPVELVVDHLCFDKRCVRPSHLEPVTQQENAERWYKAYPYSSCARGHPFKDGSFKVQDRPGGKSRRVCYICQRMRQEHRRIERTAVKPTPWRLDKSCPYCGFITTGNWIARHIRFHEV